MKAQETSAITLPDPPRAVRATFGAWVVRTIYGFGLLLPAVAVVWLIATLIRDDVRLEQGPRVIGTVVDNDAHQDSHGDNHYHLTVDFPANGSDAEERISVSHEEYDRNPMESHPLVTYSRQDVSVVRLGAMTPARAARDIAGQSAILIFGLACMLFLSWKLESVIRDSLVLLRTGRLAIATIEQIAPLRQDTKTVYYSFEAEGARWSGKSVYNRMWGFEPVLGEEVPILYPPGKPQKSVPLEYIRTAALRSRSIFERD